MIGLNRTLDTTNGLKLLGERNSGTNLLEHLLRQIPDLHLYPSLPMITWRDVLRFRRPLSAIWQYEAAREETLDDWHVRDLPTSGGWKHAAPTHPFSDQFLTPHQPAVLIIARHPADWLRSMQRNPFHALTRVAPDISDFIRQPWPCVARDGLAHAVQPDLPSLLAAKMRAYETLLQTYSNSSLIRYEDLALDPLATLRQLGLPCPEALSLPMSNLRDFAKDHTSPPDFAARAAAAGYDNLPPQDAAFVKGALATSPLSALYER